MLESIKKQQIDARKAKDTVKAKTLTVVIGEVETIVKRTGKQADDSMISSLVKKTIENLHLVASHSGYTDDVNYEIKVLEQFVLKQLSEEDIRKIKKESGATDVKSLMSVLNKDYKGMFDGKVAVTIANEK
jgi:uncharacterized protein YqeY